MKTTPMPLQRTAGLMAVLSVVLLLALTPPKALAYVLEGPHILALTAQAMGKLTALAIDQKLLIYPPDPDTPPTVLDEAVVYVMPRRFRSDIVSDQVKRTHLEVAGQSLTVIDGRIITGQDPFDRYQRLLRSRTRGQLIKALSGLGVETAISSLGRVDETVVFVLGARYPDESVSQLAVDKETFLPVRLLLADPVAHDPDQRVAIHYHNWQKIQDGWLPTQVDFFIGDHLAREIRVVQMRVNPSIPAEWMDLDALRTSIAVTQAETLDQPKQEAMEAVEQGMQEFRKKFE